MQSSRLRRLVSASTASKLVGCRLLWQCGRRTCATTSAGLSQHRPSKVYDSADAAVSDVKSGATILSSGFGLCGVAGTRRHSGRTEPSLGNIADIAGVETIIAALHKRGAESLHSLTAVSNNAGIEDQGGLAILTKAGQVKRLILSYLGANKALERSYLKGELAIELCPQGTLAERLRAGGAGIPAFFTPTGARTLSLSSRSETQHCQ